MRKATSIGLATGKKNATCTTIAAILEALDITFSEFGSYYDNISEEEIAEYKKVNEKSRKERDVKRTKSKSTSKSNTRKTAFRK